MNPSKPFNNFDHIQQNNLGKKLTAGYTILEVLVTMAIVGVLSAIALPSFNETISRSHMRSNAGLFIGALNLARIEAVKRSEHVMIAPVTAGDWNSGITVWVDTDRGADLDTDELTLKKILPIQGTGSMTSGVANVTFLSTGFISAATSFQLCDERTGETGRAISVLISGRIRTADDNTCS
jgi:prepilin-type N-terminal cleavage/methylation domain-containing protein